MVAQLHPSGSALFELPIAFPSGGALLTGRLLRNTTDLEQRQIGVVVTGSWLTVKEQMAMLYGRRLATLGYTALVFDFRGFGESAGEPRQAEIPSRKIEDISAAADFLSTSSLVVPDAIGHLAICASAQYTLHAIARGARFAAFATVAGWFHDASSIAPFYGGQQGVRRRMEFARQDLEAYIQRRPRAPAPAYAPGDERAGMYFELDYYANPTRGAVPAWKNEMAPMTWAYWLTLDGMSPAARVGVPTLMVHGPGCVLPDNAKLVYDRLAGPKRLDWLDGDQVDFYDRPVLVDRAVPLVDEWFKAHLTGMQRVPAPAGLTS